ncbi:hypothetical protein QQS21_007632 [Conoideocrella luteorostrata]|uniref:O-methyltransferase n=1 Tax=Conoideocrella luteorostrata TaxID=1105319 RepID=A0AAJ0FRW7_9HYPO|nr:hypothetical protein QQS21_007632 [Conoideocrella luteorostrata]
MDGLTELIQHAEKLYAAVKRLEGSRRGSHSSDQLWANFGEDNKDLSQSKADILASTAAIRRLAAGPTELLQDLARHTELLACLKWLAEFQILACIPVDVTISVKDLADLVGVPQDQLSRVIRLMATFGFLHQPDANSVAHTPLSAQFLDNSWLDAAVFMADHLAPTALQMSLATQRFGASQNPGESAFNLAFNTTRSFSTSVLNSHKLRRQWSAYLDHAAGLYREEDIFQALSQLNWTKLGNVCVVEVGCRPPFPLFEEN